MRGRRRARASEAWIGVAGAALALVLGGCVGGAGSPTNRGGSSSGSSAATPTSPPTRVVQRPPPVFTPGTRRTPPAAPPELEGPGDAPETTPTSQLPAPRSSADLASQLEDRFGFQIRGPGATADNLALFERGLEDFQPHQLRGLETVNFPLVRGLQPLQGLWQSDGRKAEISLYAQTGRTRQVQLHTISHELGHHISLLARRSWGTSLDRALGRGAAAYPSTYSRTQDAEKVAENIAFSLLGPDSESRALPAWSPSSQAKDLLREEFGARLRL